MVLLVPVKLDAEKSIVVETRAAEKNITMVEAFDEVATEKGWHNEPWFRKAINEYLSEMPDVAPGDTVVVHSLQGPKRYLNGSVFTVDQFDETRQRFILHRIGDTDSKVGAFKKSNLRVVDFEEHHKEIKQKLAAKYDPNGPHPPKNLPIYDEKPLLDFLELLKLLCPNVEQYKVNEECLNCGKKSEQVTCNEMKFCSRCKVAPFCSKECQKVCWASHKTTCTTREQRVQLLREKIQEAPTPGGDRSARNATDETLATALCIADEFVDGAFILIQACLSQSLESPLISEPHVIACIKKLCGIHLKKGDIPRLAEAMGLFDPIELGRKAWIASFQQIESALETPRVISLAVWKQLRPLVRKLWRVAGPEINGLIQMARGRGAPHSDVVDLCDFLGEKCETVRGDEGRAITRFLLLLGELLRNLRAHGSVVNKLSAQGINKTVDDVEARMLQGWTEIVRVFKGEVCLLEGGIEAVKRFELSEYHGMIYYELEDPLITGEGDEARLVMDHSDVQVWLAAEKGRWLSQHHIIGFARANYSHFYGWRTRTAFTFEKDQQTDIFE